MDLQDMTSEGVIKIEETLASIKAHYERKGAGKAHRLIKEKIKDSDSPRDGGIPNYEDYWRGYDRAITDVLSLLRDELIFKK